MATATPNRSSAPDPLAESERALRQGIRRRKLLDLAFALLGLSLVVGSLSILVLLFGQLLRDGAGRLQSGHYVKPDGFAPAVRDLQGTLQREGTGDEVRWILVRDPYHIANAADLWTGTQLRENTNKPVVVQGDLPAPGQLEFEATGMDSAESPEPERFSRDQVQGTLIVLGDEEWGLRPAPLPLDLGSLAPDDDGQPVVDPATLVGLQVAATPGLSKSLPLKVKAIEPLVFQGFFNSMPSREADRAGIKSALVGSILVVSVTMLLATPLGVAAGVWLEEYGRKNWFTALIEINIANLAGVPSIVWGLMALGLLVYRLDFGRSILTAGVTLGLLVLPIVIMATREAIRAIPIHIREASYGCGASKWQTVRYHIIPYSLGGILTGSIVGLSRAIGETAPLITIGALTYIAFLPEFSWSNPVGWLKSEFTVVPIQMFNWISRPDQAFHANAAAAGIILLGLTLTMNAVAIALRYRLRKRIKW